MRSVERPVRRLSSPMRITASGTGSVYPDPADLGQNLDGRSAAVRRWASRMRPSGDRAPGHPRGTSPMQRPSTIRSREALLSDALTVMEAQYASDLALDDLARRVASSRRQL